MDSETTTPSTSSNTTPSVPTPIATNRPGISFRELKKELKDVEKLTLQNLDIKSWVSELKLWIKYQHINNPEVIFTACILTSSGEPRELIQEMENGLEFGNEEDSESEEEDESQENSHNNDYPTLDEIANYLMKFYGKKEDQNVLLRELRSMKIKRDEKVKDFNIRYKSLYHKLDKKRRKRISVLDYADSLVSNREAWKRVSLKDHLSLTKAFEVAEKVDRLVRKNYSEPHDFTQSSVSHNPKINFKKKINFEPKHKDSSVDELTKKMKELKISVCFFCTEEGHYQKDCPKLKKIIEGNRQNLFEQKHLN